ncbi:alpha/beta hydrolase [Rhodococcus sp. 24CO]|uniref:alpha/beta hydrolase n=1 Tax=Rhodococcus sp. 24CO TaxID=3117460 RepID=UPI003D3535D7
MRGIRIARGLIGAATAATVLFVVSSPAVAEAGGPRVISAVPGEGRLVDVVVYSPSMDRGIPVQVLRPADTSTPAPSLYLLNGVDGGKNDATWSVRTDVPKFFADKHVNVVTPLDGAFSYYTDWLRPDPGLAQINDNNGVNMWTTFLTSELPHVIDEYFDTTGENALGGISMAGTSVLNLAMAAPTVYNSVASFSGCAMTSPGPGQDFVKVVVGIGGGNPENMWGPYNDPAWVAHDPVVNAEKLPRIPMYITTATGIPGPYDTLADPRIDNNVTVLAATLALGGGIEAATHFCTIQLADRTTALGMDNIRYNIKPAGTHSWGYWQDDLHDSWPMFAASLGL